jgi:hypothetical protein
VEQDSALKRRSLAFPEFLAEMPGALAELADFLGVPNHGFSKTGLEYGVLLEGPPRDLLRAIERLGAGKAAD